MGDPKPEAVKRFVIKNYRNPEPFVTSKDVHQEFDSVSRRTINNRLNDLYNQGEIGKRLIEPNGVVWWPLSQGADSESANS